MFRRVGLQLILRCSDIFAIVMAMMLASWLRPQLTFGRSLPEENVWLEWPVYLLLLSVWGMGFALLDIYNLRKNLNILAEIQRLVAAHIITTLAFSGTLYFSFRDISRLQVISFAALGLILLIISRVGLRMSLQFMGDKRYGTRRVLIVGAGKVGHQVLETVVQNSWTGLKMVGFVDDDPHAKTETYPHLGPLSKTEAIIEAEQINEVIFTLPRKAHLKLANLVAQLEQQKINMRVVPDVLDLVFLRSVVEDFGGMPLVTLREPVLNPLQRLTKRCFDLLFASLGLLFMGPFMALIMVLIKLDSPGPAIFRQRRVGENGRLFSMNKFRTMYHHQPNKKPPPPPPTSTHKTRHDPRVTRLGRILRRTSLDELPQLINVLKGEMSLVGPRPELPWLVDCYKPWQRKRFEVPQGITGWWQVNGRADKLMHLHTDEDLYYIKNYSLWLDLQILWRTIKVVINQRGAF